MQGGGLMSLKLEGFDEVQSKINSLGRKGKLMENKAIRNGANVLLDRMKSDVPVSTKDQVHIRDDLRVTNVTRKEGYPTVNVGPSKVTAWRAKFLVYGTVKMSPDDFMTRASDATRGEVQQTIRDEIKRGLGL